MGAVAELTVPFDAADRQLSWVSSRVSAAAGDGPPQRRRVKSPLICSAGLRNTILRTPSSR